jgi:hypothetical protein
MMIEMKRKKREGEREKKEKRAITTLGYVLF